MTWQSHYLYFLFFSFTTQGGVWESVMSHDEYGKVLGNQADIVIW